MKKILILGGGGFIGGHLSKKLKSLNHFVVAVDIKHHEYFKIGDFCDEFILGDLRNYDFVYDTLKKYSFDEIYQFAADMGGAGYLFTGDNDANIMHNSVLINLNVLDSCRKLGINKILFSSSACVYPKNNQSNLIDLNCKESDVYPADPDSEYGWEKLFSERLYLSYMKNYNLDVKIVRFHNIFGPYGTWKGGKEKVPAALCRKIAEISNNSFIEVWGDGQQTRSFLYIDECIEGVIRLMKSDFSGPINIGSEEIISINNLAKMIIDISGKNVIIKNVDGPQGVRNRNSNNDLIRTKLNWEPIQPLKVGLIKTYKWIESQI